MPSAGQIVGGRYRLERFLGAGAMGSVWAAVHLELDAPIAIKFEHPATDVTSTGSRQVSRRAGSSRREARVAARLRSPNVVRTFDFGTDEGVAFIAMELLVGESLSARLEREKRLTPAAAAEIVRQTASALDVAHREHIVHRDIKPSNLFLVCEGDHELVKVLDFGIAKWLDSDAGGEARTASARLVGSAAYMSPEQARGQTVDHRSDVWSLGVVAHEMLVGARPFAGNNIPDTLRKICAGDHATVSASLGPEYAELDAVLARALHLDPARRFQSAGELSRALAAAMDRSSSPATRRSEPDAPGAFGRTSETASYRGVPFGRRRRARALVPLALGIATACGVAALLVDRTGGDEVPSSAAAPELDKARVERAIPAAADSAPPLVSAAPHEIAPSAPASPSPRSRQPRGASSAPAPEPRSSASQLDPTFGLEIPAP